MISPFKVVASSFVLFCFTRGFAAPLCSHAHLKGVNQMMTIQKFGKLNFRHFGANSGGSDLLVGLVPGGPAISGRYFDLTAKALVHRGNGRLSAGTFSLPRHDDDTSSIGKRPDFSAVIDMLGNSIKEMDKAKTGGLVLIGHSYGSFLLLNLASRGLLPKNIHLVLVNTPTSFESHASFREELQRLSASAPETFANENEFNLWWKKALPAYLKKPLTEAQFEMLTEFTYFENSIEFTRGQTSFAELDHHFIKKNYTIDFIESSEDIRVPDGNVESLKRIYGSDSVSLVESGHFPMLEASSVFENLVLKTLDAKGGRP